MSGTNYIPRNVLAFRVWVKNLIAYALENHERWGITAPDATLVKNVEMLDALVARCTQPTHSSVDIFDRNVLRASVEKDVRNYLQGMVVHNVKVDGHDRDMMRLPTHDRKPSPVGDPVGMVTAAVKYHAGALELHIRHLEGTPFDKRANYGVKIVWDVYPFDAPLPGNADKLYRSTFTRRKKELLVFSHREAGHRAVFCLRYENSKGRTGQWGPIVSALIP